MKELSINIKIELLDFDELSETEQNLVTHAIKATDHSYAPYSRFNVGAAVALENGDIIIGANQENAAFPSSLCAERTAIFAAQAQHPDQPITTIAIAARNTGGMTEAPITPCGSCRQVILGIEDRYKKPIKVLLYGKKGIYRLHRAKDLLPLSFVDESMA